MGKIIGVRFRNAGKVVYYDPDEFDVAMGGYVVAETQRGVECGRVVMPPRELPEGKGPQASRKILRLATEEDRVRKEADEKKAREAFAVCKKKIREHGLDMKLINAEYTFDHKKLLFYFTADGRVDFRELIKDLASVFRTRIELRQIGVRDETKLLGGLGVCGRPVCCGSYMSDFIPVSIKMAKEQNLSLNPTKISGVCGRLMCCLKNEQETYEYLNRNLPGMGDLVQVADGTIGEVQSVNILKQSLRLLIEEDGDVTLEEHSAEGLEILERHKKGRSRKKEREERAERVAAARAKVRAQQEEAGILPAEEEKNIPTVGFAAIDRERSLRGEERSRGDRGRSGRGDRNRAGQDAPRGASAQGEGDQPEKKRRRRRRRRRPSGGGKEGEPNKQGQA